MKIIHHYAVVILLAGLLCASPAHAQQTSSPVPSTPAAPSQDNVDPKTFAAAKELVHSFDMNSLFKNMFDAVAKAMLPLIARDNSAQVQQAQQVAIDAVKKAFMAHTDELENNKAIVYAEIYTYDEIQQLKTFYQSPVGQKMLKTMPEMMQRSMLLDRNIMLQAMTEAKRAVADALRKNGMKVPKEMDL